MRGLFVLYIGELDAQGKGVGTWIAQSVLREAFDVHKLNKVTTEVFSDNDAALRLYEKNGFKKEGKIRQHILKDGKFKDVIFMGITRSEYENI